MREELAMTLRQRAAVQPPEALIMAGSWPGDDIEKAVRSMLPYNTVVLSGGEIDRLVKDEVTGELRTPGPLDGPAHRRNWVVGVTGAVRRHLGLPIRYRDEGLKYWHFFARRPQWGGKLTEKDVPELDYPTFAKEDWQVVRRVLDEAGRADTKFQVAIPTGYAIGVFSGPFVISEAFTQKLESEVRDMFRGPDALDPLRTVIQVDLPAEMITFAMATPLFRPRFGQWVRQTLQRLIVAAPEGTSFALHLCWGDLHASALPAWRSVKAMVQFTNILVRDWPATWPLLYVIMPFVAGKRLAPVRAWRYRWLKQLRLPTDTLLVAGILHKRQSAERARKVWAAPRSCYGGRMAVGPECGCGRCTLNEALYIFEQGERLLHPA
ncbi:MAG: hypothetical protein H0W01_04445 [Pseudonocardiales bacterium]|nr:hypothetical protein [Pseudonocardiales bacterium]